LLRFRIEDVQAGRAGIEVDGISTIVNGRSAEAVIETESARGEVEQVASQCFGDMGDAVFYRDSGGSKEFFDIWRDTDARVFDELKGFVEDAFDQRLIEEFKFRSHEFFV
jgi:hypothetical protein